MGNDIHFELEGLDEMEKEFTRASIRNVPPKAVRQLDNLMHAAFGAAESKAHIETGYLKASGRVDTHYVNDVWIGEISFAHDPGIFELARADKPSKNHPEGGHFFFNAVEVFEPYMDAAITNALTDYFGKVDI